MSTEPILEIRDLTRRFQGLVAVNAVSARIEAHKLIGLIGPNGAGKTTLFNLISGFITPSDGDILFEGRSLVGLKPHQIARLGIGRTFQNLRTLPNMTVFDNVSIGALAAFGHSPWQALFRGQGAVSRRINELTHEVLDQVGLSGQAGELAANLSYGRRKYLEIARALATRPKLLILDEPAAGLNDTETAKLAEFITGLVAQGMTILLVEHDMPLVMGICDRVIVLASGAKIADADPETVQRDPAVLESYLGTRDA
ncbi:ABC transporter ATP-binding protein [Telmatospirillum sp.]|uniref:ABC transporter ATP-binding protein n=1 Tax=Telmatospirillum sp. TaxID=2079197 RepID=UPI00283E62C2|nr:ABC transporter ATP-binding protein [Telmatospirillum sp.]MDR3440964.1 ABC transporter ATP-binding protein [Telmatospirillum sp.]